MVMTTPDRPVAICVPVRDETRLLPRFLDAIAALRREGSIVLCLFFDNCADDSQTIAAARAGSFPFEIVAAVGLGGDPPSAGRARRRAMALGVEALTDADHTALLTTDADSLPAPDWMCRNLAALAVADVVAGRVIRESGAACPAQDRLETYYDALFALRRALDPVPWEAARTHHCTSGASLAFRVDAYRAIGGFEALPAGEDARIIDAAHRAGLRVRRDDSVRVATSSRRRGRARGGLADHLRDLDDAARAGTPLVAHPEDAAWRYRGQAAARAIWPDVAAGSRLLAARLGCDVAHVERVAADSPNAEAFAMRVVPDAPAGERLVTLDEAEYLLARSPLDEQSVAA